jgi:AraC family transcriptional regulator
MAAELKPVTLGTVDGTVEVGGFRLTESRHPAGTVLARHAHAHGGFTHVLDGGFAESYGARTHEMARGGLLCKPAAEAHSNRYGTRGAHSLLVEVLPWRAAQIRECGDSLDRVWASRAGIANARAGELHREMVRGDAASALSLEALSLEIFAAATRAEGGDRGVPPWLAAVRDSLHDRFAEPLRVADLAAAAGVHPVHLARAFRRHFGAAPGEYLRRVRLDWARDQVVRGALPLARIALEAGFADQSHLTRAFRARFGATPARLRRDA